MKALTNKLKAITEINEDEIWFKFLRNNEEGILNLNRYDQLFNEGINSDGVNLDNIGDKRLYDSLKRSQDRVPKSIRTSISGYDIFKIPRDPEDDSDGYLTASFSSGTESRSSPMCVIQDIVEKWMDCYDD